MAKKRKKTSIPKRLAGVKIPKGVRRGLRKFAKSQNGRTMAIEAVAALGVAFAVSQAKRGSSLQSKVVSSDLAGAAVSTSQAVRYATGEAIRTFTDCLRRGKAEADARAAWPEAVEDRARIEADEMAPA